MSYAFSFDASACTGCKACQAACKDKNNLPVGVLWRRVVEVSGGEWSWRGNALTNSVFAYNLSMACNHCVHPKCAGVCPVNAYHVRADGIVLLDSARCVGCGYCNWACPYAVPQYDAEAGVMSKCNFCCDNIDAGKQPACVAACPMRALDFGEASDLEQAQDRTALWNVPGVEHPFPLPTFSRTQPHLLLKPHPAMSNELEKSIANREEIRPQTPKSELPLVIFTLLGQMAVGAFWAAHWLFAPLWARVDAGAYFLRLLPGLMVGLCLGLGLLASFMHLGNKRNAWRVLANLRKSWLSKEILFLSFFGAGWFLSLFTQAAALILLTALCGLGLVYSMANVYQLRSMPAWNNRRTLAGFLLAAGLLGQFLLMPVLLYEANSAGIDLPQFYLGSIGWVSAGLLLVELALAFSARGKTAYGGAERARMVLILLVMSGAVLTVFAPRAAQIWLQDLLFLALLGEESIGRWLFYAELGRRAL